MSSSLGYLTAVAAAVIWGLVYAVRQKTLPFISPLGMMFVSAVVTLVLITPIILMNRSHLSQIAAAKWSDIGWVLLASVISFVALWLLFVSIEKLGATTAAMIEISYPLFVVLFCWLLMGTTVNWAVLVGGALIFCGSCVIMLFGKSS